jgi:hypothetical protein
LLVDVTGPPEKTLGEMAMFTITVTNREARPVAGVKVAATFDSNFDPNQGRATQGRGWEGKVLTWNLPNLAAGATSRFQVEIRTIVVAPRACVDVVVTSPDGARATGQACTAIKPAPMPIPQNLEVTIEDRFNPIDVGKEKTLVVRVENRGAAPQAQVSLNVTIPPQLVVNNLQTLGPTAAQVQQGFVRFGPLATLPPGATAEYRVRVRAKQLGEATVRAEATSLAVRQPAFAEKNTSIVAP